MTTRLMKTQKTKQTPAITLMCPSCRCPRRCKPVGIATIGKRRREALQCTEPSCELTWIPARDHLPPDAATALQAA